MTSPNKPPKGKSSRHEVHSGLNHRAIAAAALILASEPGGRMLGNLTKTVAQKRKAVEDLEARLRGEVPVFDFESDSLQKRLLAYFKSVKNPRSKLRGISEVQLQLPFV
jgi:hypothetical protein